ncbi:MAG TPA: hypothetical protein PKK05_19205, partial [Leptospiraceae bacterium]|nr:hypothetical protein [Leptospiraceae bacterium]
PLSKNRRKHLHRQIDDYRCEMTHTTDRKTNTETLVCTKTRKKYESRIKRYEQNKKILEKLEKISIGNSP